MTNSTMNPTDRRLPFRTSLPCLGAVALLGVLLILPATRAGAADPAPSGEPQEPVLRDIHDLAQRPFPARVLRRVALPTNAIVTQTDTFPVFVHGFDDLAGNCNPRSWKGEDLTARVYAHVSNRFLADQPGFVTMGSRALWFGADSASAPGDVANWVRSYGFGVGWSQRLISPAFSRVAHPNAVLSFDANLDNTSSTVPGTVLTSGIYGNRAFGVEALKSDGSWTFLNARYSWQGGPATWAQTPPLFVRVFLSPAGRYGHLGGVAFSPSGDVYLARTDSSQILRYTSLGTFLTRTGSPGSGPGQFNGPTGIALDQDTSLYVVDSGNNRIQKIARNGTTSQWGGPGTGDGQFSGPVAIAVSREGNVYVADAGNNRIQEFASNGVFLRKWGSFGPDNSQFNSPSGIAVDGFSHVYVVDTGNNRVQEFSADGNFIRQWGSPGTGSGQFVNPHGVAVDGDGYVYVADEGNNRIQKFGADGSFLLSWGGSPGAISFLSPHALAIKPDGSVCIADSSLSGFRVTRCAASGPMYGKGVLKFVARLGEDGNPDLGLAEPLRMRIALNNGAGNCAEFGDLPAGRDVFGAVVDNIALRDSLGDIVPPVDFEDGTTGSWTLSALNGRQSSASATVIRDVPPPATNVELRKGFDPYDPTCTWTFLSPGDTLANGTYARLVSPWFSLPPGDTAFAIRFTGRLSTFDEARLLLIYVRGKNAGDVRPRHYSVPNVAWYGGFGDDSGSELGYRMPFIDFPAGFTSAPPLQPLHTDSLQLVFEVYDQGERMHGSLTGRPTTRLPILDDLEIDQYGVDRDFDGVADGLDVCPDSCGAGQDADGNGCVDPTATMRHVESWAASALPLHYVVSAHGSPQITNGSEFIAIANGFGAWTNVPGTSLFVIQDPPTPQTNASGFDGVNLVTFEDDYVFPPNVVAITPTTSALQRTTFNDQIVLPGQIVDSDMIFNPQMPFRTDSYNPGGDALDLQSVVTHEAGHFYGLSHSGVLNSTMFFVLQPGQGARSLEADDQAAIAAAYPGPSFATNFATITGQVTRGGTGYAIPGALVTAVHLDALSQPADSVASDYTDEGGNYALRGLAPGSYSLRVTPLDGEVGGYALTPDYISERVSAIAQTNFDAEWWSVPESDRDTPAQRGVLTLAAGETRTAINVITNVDTIPPQVVSVSPRADTTNVRIDTSILVNFSERIDPNSLQNNFRLHEQGLSNALGGNATLVSGGRSIVFTPTLALKSDTAYVLDLTTGLMDRQGVHLASPFSSRFTTEAAPPVAITDIQPRKAARGAFITILGTGFDPAGVDSVEFPMSVFPGYVRGPAASVAPASMVVRVPLFASSGQVRVEVNGVLSNPFGLTVLPPTSPTAPSHVTDVSLSFSPTDVAVSPEGARAFAVGSGGLADIDLATSQVSYANIGAATRLVLSPDGKRAVVTRPGSSDVVSVGTDPANGGTYHQVIGRTPLVPGAVPQGIALSPNGLTSFVSDPVARLVYKIDLDPLSVMRDSVLAEIRDSTATPSGGLAVMPDASGLLYGTLDAGARYLGADSIAAVPWAVASSSGGVAVAPGGFEALFAGSGFSSGALLSVFILGGAGPSTPPSNELFLGGEVRDVIYSPDGKSAYAVNSAFNQIQMMDMDTSSTRYHDKIAEVGTGATPVAISVNGAGDVIAVANYGGRSVSVYRTGGTAALVRATPATARPGDVVALQGTGLPFGAGSQVDVGSGPFAPARRAPGSNGAAFVVPDISQRDGSVAAVDSSGLRTLGLPFQIVDPISTVVPRETGFARMLDSVLVSPPGVYFPTSFTSMTLSPDGKMMAITRALSSMGEQLDLVLVGEDGINRMGAILASHRIVASGDQVLGTGFTPDGKQLWVTYTGLLTKIVDTDPGSPSFGTQVATLPIHASANVGPIGVDPLGRYMIEGDYAFTDSLHLYTPAGDPVGAIAVGGWIKVVTVSRDGRYVVSAGNGRVNVGDLDSLVALPGPLPHGSTTSRDWSIAIPLNGKRAVVRYPDTSFGIYNLDPAAGAVGTELYYGNPLPVGVAAGMLASAPDGKNVLVSRPGQDALSVLDPSVIPPAVSTVATERPIAPLAMSADGRRLWTEAGAGTTRDSLRLVTLSPAASLSLVAGGGQSGLTSSWLPERLRFRATDSNGNPQAGAMLRFDGVSGLLPILDNWDTPLWHLTDANGEVAVRWRTSSVPGTDSLVVRVLGVPAASVLATAQVLLADNLLPPVVVSLGPADGATNLNAGTGVSATFNKAMDSTSVAAHLALYVGTNSISGTFKVSVDSKTFFFQPLQPRAFSSRCSLTVQPGVLDTYGNATTSGATSVFTVQPQPTLAITSLTPPAAPAGSPVVIAGAGFNPVPAQNTAYFNGVLAPVTSATALSVVVNVPQAASTGPLTVQNGSVTSNALTFQVLTANPGPGGVVENFLASPGVRDVAITSDGQRAYITNPTSNSISALDIPGAQTITSITVGLQPQGIALLPDDSRAYVANTGSNNVSVIDIRPASADYNKVVANIPVGTAPMDIAVSAKGPQVVVANSGSHSISIIDANPGNGTFDQVTGTVNVGSSAQSVTVAPDGGRAYVGTSGGTVVVIDLASDAVTGTVNVGSSAQSVTVLPDGTILLVLCQDGTIKIVNVAPGSPKQYQVTGTVNVGSSAQSVTVSPDGARVYVTNKDGNSVLVYSIAVSNVPGAVVISPGPAIVLTLVATIPVGEGPAGIAFDPSHGAFALVCNSGSGTVSKIAAPLSLPPVLAEFDLDPDVLILAVLGHWMTGYIEPQPPFQAADILLGSIRLNGVVPVDTTQGAVLGDHDHDGIPDLKVKFDRRAVALLVPDGDHVPVTVTGTVGTRLFTGTDTIRVIRPNITAPAAGSMLQGGQPFTVRWQTPCLLKFLWVAVLHSFDHGATWRLDATHLQNTGSYVWAVPDTTADSVYVAVVLVEREDSDGSDIYGVLAVSDPFSIVDPTTAVEPPPAVLSFAPIRPNPAAATAHMRYGLPRAADVRIEVFDVQGRRVHTLASGPRPAGWHDVSWNGRLEGGSRIGAGLYFVRFQAEGREFRQRLVWLR